LREIQPDGVHPGVRTPNVRGVSPTLHKIPAHMVKLRPLQDQIRRIVYGHGIHFPDDLLAGLRIRHELLLLEEFVEFWQGMPLVPAPPFVTKSCPKESMGSSKSVAAPSSDMK